MGYLQVVVLEAADVADVGVFLEKLERPPYSITFHNGGADDARKWVRQVSFSATAQARELPYNTPEHLPP